MPFSDLAKQLQHGDGFRAVMERGLRRRKES
jgi:hypothetical protein